MLEFRNVCAGYGRKRVLNGVSFQLIPHKMTAVIGRNGCGKSTLVSCVNGQLRYTGEITFSEKNLMLLPLRERAQTIAILPQLLSSVSVTVEELVAMGRNPYLDLGKRLTETDRSHIEAALRQTGMEELRFRPLNRLSGGERQKAYLAMVLAQNTRVVILDEPTTYMDMQYEAEFMNLLDTLKRKEKKTLMVVMHDLTRAVELADDIVLLEEGCVRFYGSTAECAKSGLIEQAFRVRRCDYEEDGVHKILYHG